MFGGSPELLSFSAWPSITPLPKVLNHTEKVKSYSSASTKPSGYLGKLSSDNGIYPPSKKKGAGFSSLVNITTLPTLERVLKFIEESSPLKLTSSSSKVYHPKSPEESIELSTLVRVLHFPLEHP